MPVKNPLIKISIPTVDGSFIARYSDQGLVQLDFPSVCGVTSQAAKDEIVSAKIRGWHRATVAALKNVLAGRPAKKLPPIDWSGKTEFQKCVWRALLKITPGKTRSYGRVAQAIGKPKAVRAVGGACGANPIPVLVPCHRVLAANKKLGGYSGGLDWKRSLLVREGIKIESD
jgi:O-6-methylguanine DNA methyltransferase